jgi:ATP-dependent Clp protease adapter protein ClpS
MRQSNLQRLLSTLSILLFVVVTACHAFSPAFQSASPLPRSVRSNAPLLESTAATPRATVRGSGSIRPAFYPRQQSDTRLFSSLEKTKVTKKSVLVKDRTETKPEEQKKKEEQWRVVLHNDEVHTFNYVIRSLCKVIGTLDRKAAFEICVQTHGIGKATITKTWKKQAEQFCLGLQRQGLTVSISPDEDFDGGHSGGGL